MSAGIQLCVALVDIVPPLKHFQDYVITQLCQWASTPLSMHEPVSYMGRTLSSLTVQQTRDVVARVAKC